MFRSTEGVEVVRLMGRTRLVSHLLLESRAITKIQLIVQRLEAGGRLSENTTEVWWFGTASLDNGVATLQTINVLMSAHYTPSDEPDSVIVDLLAEHAALCSSSPSSNHGADNSVFVFGAIHSNCNNRTISSSFLRLYSSKFAQECREVGVQTAIYVEYDALENKNEETSPSDREKFETLNDMLRAQVFDIKKGVRYHSHVMPCYYPPQSIAERNAFVSEFLSHVEVRKAPEGHTAYEDELKKLLASLRPHQRRLLRGRSIEEIEGGNSESGGIDREE